MAHESQNMLEKINRTYFSFVVLSAALSLVFVSASPFLFFISLSCLSASYLFSYKKWATLHDPQSDGSGLKADNLTKAFIAVFLGLLCIYFLQIYALAQMVLAIVSGAALSAAFFESILKSQEKIDESLRKAARDSNPEHTKILLERGADPFAPDNSGHNAVRYAIRNNAFAAQIIETALTHAGKPAPKLRDLLPGVSDFWGNNVEERQRYVGVWSEWFDAWKGLVTAFSAETRAEFQRASSALISLYTPLFPRMINSLILYLRHQTANPNEFVENIPSPYTAHLSLIELDANTHVAISHALATGKRAAPAAPLSAPEGWTTLASVASAVRFMAPSLVKTSAPNAAPAVVELSSTPTPAPTPTHPDLESAAATKAAP